MRAKRALKGLILGISILGFTACGDKEAEKLDGSKIESNSESEITEKYTTVKAEDGSITIDPSLFTEHASYINYDANGTTIQLIGVIASDGTPRISFNTCQSCNPSPKAYFMEEKGMLICQNCGNVFRMDSVGKQAGGCNPMAVDHEIVDDKIVIDSEKLDSYAEAFASWSGPTE
ncbi:MAG: Fe-S-containing protein [Lachnospiraceae bacterium]|nr:Fe-S-containing protein [Lachnospiraceae bacterium]